MLNPYFTAYLIRYFYDPKTRDDPKNGFNTRILHLKIHNKKGKKCVVFLYALKDL